MQSATPKTIPKIKQTNSFEERFGNLHSQRCHARFMIPPHKHVHNWSWMSKELGFASFHNPHTHTNKLQCWFSGRLHALLPNSLLLCHFLVCQFFSDQSQEVHSIKPLLKTNKHTAQWDAQVKAWIKKSAHTKSECVPGGGPWSWTYQMISPPSLGQEAKYICTVTPHQGGSIQRKTIMSAHTQT